MQCANVQKRKNHTVLVLLLFTFSPLILALIGAILGTLGIISTQFADELEFVGGWFMLFTLIPGGIFFVIASLYFSHLEKKCGIVPKFSLLRVLAGLIIGTILIILFAALNPDLILF